MNARVQMEKVLQGSFQNTVGMMVLKDSVKVYENYYKGFTAENRVHIASATKSIIGALVGIAVGQEKLGIDQKILDFFPNYPVTRGEKTLPQITVRDILTMTVPYKCKTEPFTKMFMGKEWVKLGLDIMGGKGKIGEFIYSPMVGIQVLSGILTQAIEQPILTYAKENLFKPLDIMVENNLIYKNADERVAFLEAKNVSGWVVDPEGINTAGWGLSLSVDDMAKLGQLYMQNGSWEGKQIIPTQWIADSTKEQSRCKQWKLSYGYLWWVIDGDKHIYAAMGSGGNTIYVNTEKKLVVAILCSYMPQATDRVKFIQNYVEPAFC